jgi:putative Mg2+ transporter-C (MgtC) family protein
VTAAIGMAAGAGLFLLSTATTLLVLLCLEAQNVLLRRLGHRHLDITFATDTREDVDRVLQHLNTLDGVIADSLNMETATAPLPHYTVKLQLRLQRRQFRHRILDFMGEMKGVDVLSIE